MAGDGGNIVKVTDSVVARLLSRAAMVLTLPVVLWIAAQFDGMRSTQLQLTLQIRALRERVEERTSDRYTGAQAERDWRAQSIRDDRQDDDRKRVERRVDILDGLLRSRQQ